MVLDLLRKMWLVNLFTTRVIIYFIIFVDYCFKQISFNTRSLYIGDIRSPGCVYKIFSSKRFHYSETSGLLEDNWNGVTNTSYLQLILGPGTQDIQLLVCEWGHYSQDPVTRTSQWSLSHHPLWGCRAMCLIWMKSFNRMYEN